MTTPERKTKTPPEGELAQILAVLEANTTLLAFFFGLCFVAALLVLAIWFPNPTAFQYTVFRITLALAAAGIAGVIPGMIRLKMQPGAMLMIHAGGALAVFVMVYLLAPAALPPEQEQSAPSSPPPKEKPEKRVKVKPLQPLRISNVDAVENGVHILNFTPPINVHVARLRNIGDIPIHVSLIGFPGQIFYTNLIHDFITIQENSIKEVSIVFKCNLPQKKEYFFEIQNTSTGDTIKIAIRIKDGWVEYLSQQITQLQKQHKNIPLESIPKIFEAHIGDCIYILSIEKEKIIPDIPDRIFLKRAELRAEENLFDFLSPGSKMLGLSNLIQETKIVIFSEIDKENGYAIAMVGITPTKQGKRMTWNGKDLMNFLFRHVSKPE